MPIYEYRCAKGHTFEVMQRMADDTLSECTICGAPVQRVFHPVAVHFKGSGFYTTDYGKKKGSAKESKSDSGSGLGLQAGQGQKDSKDESEQAGQGGQGLQQDVLGLQLVRAAARPPPASRRRRPAGSSPARSPGTRA